jgi:hypothetical protein
VVSEVQEHRVVSQEQERQPGQALEQLGLVQEAKEASSRLDLLQIGAEGPNAEVQELGQVQELLLEVQVVQKRNLEQWEQLEVLWELLLVLGGE